MKRLSLAFLILALLAAACQQQPTTVEEATSPDVVSPSPPPVEATVQVVDSSRGRILADAGGRTVYVFMNDTEGTSICYDACEQRWPPLVVTGEPQAGEGVQADLLTTSPRRDGSTQVVYNGHPLYHFSGDSAPGDTNGQGFGDVWFVVSPEGEPVRS